MADDASDTAGGVAESTGAFDPAPARAKLFKHGGSQAVRLPKAFRFEGDEVSVRREGDRVILESVQPRPPRSDEEWKAFWARVDGNRDPEDLFPYPPPQPLAPPPADW